MAAAAKALAHPARIAILKILSKRKECICGEIVEGLPLAQATVSQHLKELKSVGLIAGTIDGPTSCYCIDWKALEEMTLTLNELLQEMKANQTQCC